MSDDRNVNLARVVGAIESLWADHSPDCSANVQCDCTCGVWKWNAALTQATYRVRSVSTATNATSPPDPLRTPA